MMAGERALVLAAGEGRDISLAQHRQRRIVVKADEASTAGAYRLFESTVPAATAGAPLHLHEAAEEGFYVLDGALTIVLDQREVVAGPGTFVMVPRGVVHSFDNRGSEPARYLVLWSPAEAGRYFEELFELEKASHGEPSREAIAALRKKYRFVYL